MKFNRYWLYPRVRNWRRIIPYVFIGTAIAGVYGAIHDQLSYTISPEYFTHFKFYQFHYADFGLPNRVFVSIIGFLATWWVGGIVGWFLARTLFNSDDLSTARKDILKGFAIVFACAATALVVGAVVGYVRAYHFSMAELMGWEREFSGVVLQRFAVVGIIHNSSYLGGLLGLVVAIVV